MANENLLVEQNTTASHNNARDYHVTSRVYMSTLYYCFSSRTHGDQTFKTSEKRINS